MLRRVSFFAATLIGCAVVSLGQETAQVSVIRAGKLLDVESGRLLTNQMIVVRAGKIEAVGEHLTVPPGGTIVDLSKFTVLPGLIDCHTHLIHGGSRVREWELRLAGTSYTEIARQGGGILTTVHGTRALKRLRIPTVKPRYSDLAVLEVT